MTNAQEIAIGTNGASGGLLVYNTTLNELDVYDSASGQWEAVGANAADAAGSTGQVQFNLNSNNDLGASANLFWDNTHNRLGIGTATPTGLMSTYGNNVTLFEGGFNVSGGNPTFMSIDRSDGTNYFTLNATTISGLQNTFTFASAGITFSNANTWANPITYLTVGGHVFDNPSSGTAVNFKSAGTFDGSGTAIVRRNDDRPHA